MTHQPAQLAAPPRSRPATLADAIRALEFRCKTKAEHLMVGETEQCLAVLQQLERTGVPLEGSE